MKTFEHIAKSLEELHFGGNWTASNITDQLADVTWQEATTEVYELNTIAILVNHIHYYIRVATKVLEGGPLEGKDKESFTHETISSDSDWQTFLATRYEETRSFVNLIQALPDEKLESVFGAEKYGNYYRNLQGIVEHSHYHLGQIVLLKKILRTHKS